MIILLVLFIIIFIILLIRENKKKKTLMELGVKFNELIELNDSYQADPIDFTYTKQIYVDSKPRLNRLSLEEIAMKCYYDNEATMKDEYEEFNRQKELYYEYTKKFNKIYEKEIKYDEDVMRTTIFKTPEDFVKYENKQMYKKRKSFCSVFELKVRADYISPQGRNHWYREQVYMANDISSFIEIIKKRTEYEQSARYQRELMSDSLRYDVLKRDNYTCRICGATAAEGAKLEVDHIKPVSKGGTTTMDNLQTLCRRCNRGKSAKY